MAGQDSLIEQLQEELRHEALSRQLQKELNSKLQDEYDELLKRLAEAELHIDRMRFGTNIDLNKYFIIRHHTEHHNTLRQQLEAQFDPSWRKPLQPGDDTKPAVTSTGVGTDGSSTTHKDDANLKSFDHIKDGKLTTNTPESQTLNDIHHSTRGSSSDVQNGKDSNEAANCYVPLSPHIEKSSGNSLGDLANEISLKSLDHSSQLVETSASAIDSSSSTHFIDHHTSNGFRGLKGRQNILSESQELLLQSINLSPSLTHSQLSASQSQVSNNAHLDSIHHHASTSSPSSSPVHPNSSHHHTSSSYTSTNDTCLSQMSAGTIEIRGSTESMQLAHLFKIHSLQEELDHLKSKLNNRSVPLEEIVQDASRIHQQHQQLARDVESLSTNVDALRKKNSGRVSDHIAKSKRAIENELTKVAEQLQELYAQLHARVEEEGSNFPLPRTPTSLIERKDSDSQLHDSLNSPYLPTKYLNDETSLNNQLSSPQGPPLSDGKGALSTDFLLPSHSSTPHESNSSAQFTSGVLDSKRPSTILPLRQLDDGGHQAKDDDVGKNGSNCGETKQHALGESDSSTPLEQLIELGASGHVVGKNNDIENPNHNTLSDLSDILPSDDEEDKLHLPKDNVSNRSDWSPTPSDLSHMNPAPSPDSLYLQEAKKNLKRAKELGYSNNSHPDSHSSRDDYSSHSISSQNETTIQGPTDVAALSSTLNPATGNGRKNTLSLPLSTLKKHSQIPRLVQSEHSPRPHLRGANPSYPHCRQRQNSTNTTGGMNIGQASTTFPGEGDSGFAGSEFPSRTATRMDTTDLAGRERDRSETLASSLLQSTISEDGANQQRFVEATAAIEALRKELADLKLQMMRNVKHSGSIPRTPSLRSHSTKGPTSPTITTSHVNSHDYLSSSSQPKLLSREFLSNPSALASPLHGSETPSTHLSLTGGQSSQMTTNTNTPSHSGKSTGSPSHTYSGRRSSTAAVSKIDLCTPRSSPSRRSSSVRLSTPALSSYASLRRTPIPTPQHSITGNAMTYAASTRPNSIASSRYVDQPDPSIGYASSYVSSDVPVGWGSAQDHYESEQSLYYHSSQPNSVTVSPSIISGFSNRGSVNQYQPLSYEEANVLESRSNLATVDSSVATTAMTVPTWNTEDCPTEIHPNLAVHNNDMCHQCGERATQLSHTGTRSSDISVTPKYDVYPHNSIANPAREQGQSHRSVGSRGTEVDTANAIVQSDHELGHGPQLRSKDISRLTNFDSAQRPRAASTPSRRSAVLNARQTQILHDVRGSLNGRCKPSKDVSVRENFTEVPASSIHNDIAASRATPDLDVTSTDHENNSHMYSVTSHSPQRKKSGENFVSIYSVHSSPARSHTHSYGSSSGVCSSVQSSPGHGYSNARRASSPALYANAHKRSYGEPIMDGYGSAKHSDYRVQHLEDSSSDNRTPHVHMPTREKHATVRSHKSLHHHNYYSDTETSPEHHYQRACGHTKPRVVRVIETPRVRKKRVVYVASESPPPEEIYYSESGLFTRPRSVLPRRRVVGVVGSRSSRSVSRNEGARMAHVRGGVKPRKVYVEQPSEPVKRVYIVEQESGSDLEQLETIEMHDLDLEDTLRLAHELKRRTRRLQGTLHAELERQAFH